jgi:hypothetical protein
MKIVNMFHCYTILQHGQYTEDGEMHHIAIPPKCET